MVIPPIFFFFLSYLEIFRENPSRKRECLYYLALGHYKTGAYKEARQYNDSLLAAEPKNPQALSLKSLIDEKVRSGK